MTAASTRSAARRSGSQSGRRAAEHTAHWPPSLPAISTRSRCSLTSARTSRMALGSRRAAR